MMTKTSWNRSFSAALALAALLVLSTLAAPAAAVSVGSEDVPGDAQVGSQVTATVTLTELYRNPQLEEWQLAGETELTDVTWTVTYIDQTGAKVGQESFDGQTFDGAAVVADNGTAEVEVRITGTVPEVTEYAYDPAQSFTVMALSQTRQGGSSNAVDEWTATHYTESSRSAREALDAARAAIDSAEGSGASVGEAEEAFGNAVDAYESGNFDLATNLAEEAESRANSAQQSNQLFQYALYAVGGLVVLGLLAGGVLYWRSQQDSYDKLG